MTLSPPEPSRETQHCAAGTTPCMGETCFRAPARTVHLEPSIRIHQNSRKFSGILGAAAILYPNSER